MWSESYSENGNTDKIASANAAEQVAGSANLEVDRVPSPSAGGGDKCQAGAGMRRNRVYLA